MKMSELKMGDFFDSPYLPSERYMFLYSTLKLNNGIYDTVIHAMRVSDYLMVHFIDKELDPPKELNVDNVNPGSQFFHGKERFTKLRGTGRVQLRSGDTIAYDNKYVLRIFSTQTKVHT